MMHERQVPRIKRYRALLGALFRKLFVAALILSVTLILPQDILIFPGVIFSGWGASGSLPDGVESIFVETDDGVRLELWRYEPESLERTSDATAVIFHGNAGTVRSFFPIQRWFSEQNIVSYGFDYRGFGSSGGWPSEKGIYLDARAVWNYVRKREGVSPEQVIIYGISIGTGPASELAQKIQPGTLVLLSPYTSLPALLDDRFPLGLLKPFLWYKFPASEYVSRLTETCLIAVVGGRDRTIKPYHAKVVLDSYKGPIKAKLIKDPDSGHNDLFFRTRGAVAKALADCLNFHTEAEL